MIAGLLNILAVYDACCGPVMERAGGKKEEEEVAERKTLMSNDLWYALPLVIAASLVYGATRHESMPAILLHSLRMAAGWSASWPSFSPS